ncbi:hypothetical protein C8J56DRAFT_38316 [Mycena floridula]|nr:hypothetical protein C8J56DRAFT_38316 [Mycena floridula]
MFSKLCILALVAPFALVSAFTVDAPKNPTSGGEITINWTTNSSDPTVFSMFLTNDAFHQQFAIANNVNSADHSKTLELPIVLQTTGFTIICTATDNVNDVFATSPGFDIGLQVSTTASSSTTTTTKATSTATNTNTKPTSIIPATSTSAFGNTITRSDSGSSAGASGTGTTSAPASSNTPFNAAFSTKGALSTVLFAAGAVILAL